MNEVQVFYDDDADVSELEGKKIAVLGLGMMGNTHLASWLKRDDAEVVVVSALGAAEQRDGQEEQEGGGGCHREGGGADGGDGGTVAGSRVCHVSE